MNRQREDRGTFAATIAMADTNQQSPAIKGNLNTVYTSHRHCINSLHSPYVDNE